jgi:group II intron reverse transcriptase/maturase
LTLKRQAAPGVDGVTWRQYEEGFEDRIVDLHQRVHRGTYRAQPSKRTYIPKSDGRKRPLGIAALEDKIVQQAVLAILNQVYEVDFVGFSYGFRPGRSQHQALDALWVGLMGRVSWVLDADIQGFFDAIDHGWMLKFLEHRIGGRRLLRLVRKWLRAGISENGEWSRTTRGTPQGAVISPLLANVYLHYLFDLWAHHWRQHKASGDVVIVRYADDVVVGFQYRNDAERFRRALRERMSRFGLVLHPKKTRLIEFGRFAARNRRQRGEGKPETFDFLGFTHICGNKYRKEGFIVRRLTSTKRFRAKLKEIRQTLMFRRHQPVPELGRWLRRVVQGYYNYHAIPGNAAVLAAFRTQVARAWLRALRRRSQRHRMPWRRFSRLVSHWLPNPRILHEYPNVRFFARHPR